MIFATGFLRKEKVRGHVPKDHRRAPWFDTAALLAVGAVALALFTRILILSGEDRPMVIDRITVVNPSAYRLEVEASSPRNGAKLKLGVVESQSEASFRNVSDQGKFWHFGFLFAGKEVGALAVGEDRLKRRDWRLVVPMDVEVHLRAVAASPAVGRGAP